MSGMVRRNVLALLAATGGSALIGHELVTVKEAINLLSDEMGTVKETIDLLDTTPVTITESKYWTSVNGDGINDKSAELFAANQIGKPIAVTGILVILSATTITVPIVNTGVQLFSTASIVTIDNGEPVHPEWWGNGQQTIEYAVNALPASGGIVQLENKTYLPNGFAYGFGGVGSGKYISKPNVMIQGRKMPSLTADCKSLTGGSIIQGMVLAYADNISFRDLGVDCGYNVVQTYHAGVPSAGVTEGLVITYPDGTTKTASPLKTGVKLHNVIGLCASPTAPVHAIIAGEGVANVSCTGEVIGCYGVHGVVFKCQGVNAESITAYCNGDDGVIIKSDAQATAVSNRINIGKISSHAKGPVGAAPYAVSTTGYGLLFDAAGNNIDSIHIVSIETSGYPKSVGTRFGGNYVICSVNINYIYSDQLSVTGNLTAVDISASAGQNITRYSIGKIDARNTNIGLNAVFPQTAIIGNSNFLQIGHIKVVNANNAVVASGASHVSIDDVFADNCSDGVYKISGTAKLKVGSLSTDPSTSTIYSASGLAPELKNGWSDYSYGNELFGVDLTGYRVNLRGLLVPSGSNIITNLPAWARPNVVKRFMAQGRGFGGVVAVPVTIAPNGNVLVNEVDGGYGNCNYWFSLSGISFELDR